MSVSRFATVRAGGVSQFVPYAILGVMVVTMALLPALTSYTVRTANVYDIFQNFASYALSRSPWESRSWPVSSTSPSRRCISSRNGRRPHGSGSPLAGILAALGAAIIVGCVQGASSRTSG